MLICLKPANQTTRTAGIWSPDRLWFDCSRKCVFQIKAIEKLKYFCACVRHIEDDMYHLKLIHNDLVLRNCLGIFWHHGFVILEVAHDVRNACIFVTNSSRDKFYLFIFVGNAVAVNQIICRRNKPECHHFTRCWVQSFGASGRSLLLARLSS